MKKTRAPKNINRNNNTIINHGNRTSRMNTISPEVLVGSMWLQEDNPNSVQIIELNSSNSEASPKESQNYNTFSHAWSYINNDRFQQQEDHYKINKKARERRRLRNNNPNLLPNSPLDTSNGYETENIYPNIASNHINKNNVALNRQNNCFTIINKHILDSDTASDNLEYEELEILTPRDYFKESELWEANRSYDNETITYEPEHDQEKRTIWIYSFKNKPLLSENDFKLDNLSSIDTTSCSTSCSIENFEVENKNDNSTSVCRVATPIPATYVPRFNLSLGSTLPTVSEVTEPTKAPISESVTSMNNEVITLKQNGWFINDNKKVGSDTVLKKDTSTNVIEWMGLSPRERRRRFKNSNVSEKLPTLPEINSYTEVLSNHIEQQNKKFKPNESSQVVVDVDVHITDDNPGIKSLTSPNNASIEAKVNVDAIDKVSSEDIDEESGKDDRGDRTRMNSFRRPQIRVISKLKMEDSIISDPIDKLESDNWILEEREEKQTATYDYVEEVKVKLPQADENVNSASRKLWKRNFSLMKPPEWSEYLSIGDSPLFLHLSLDSLDEIKQTWYRRIFKYFKCCTKDQS